MGFSISIRRPSRTASISILLAITASFFVVEIVVGYYSNSLALIADSFHMLSDVISMFVALYAIRITKRARTKTLHPRYSYGLHRAEIVAALINGVFLLALCFTICLEALGRFYNKPDVSDPRLVVIVGCVGLGCNLLGLVLFHEHSHGHGHGHSHGHDHSEKPSGIEQAMPAASSATVVQGAHEASQSSSTPELGDEDSISSPSTPGTPGTPHLHGNGHPAAMRASVIEAGQRLSHELNASHQHSSSSTSNTSKAQHSHSHGGHSHGSMNMRALMLHVMGDAGGNLAVISSGLVMWLTKWSFRFYFDPAVSLLFAIIIFIGAIPLVRSACLVLLQAAPPHISVESVRESILAVRGVISLHELHVWQLSENKAIASVHITTCCDERTFMLVAADIKKRLHELGIHSCTIQPEYKLPVDGLRRRPTTSREGGEDDISTHSDDTLCMLRCPEDFSCHPAENACCPPIVRVDSGV